MTISIFKLKIKEKLWVYIERFFYSQKMRDSNAVLNINYNNGENQQKLLISYKANGYFINLENKLGRTVLFEIFEIAKIFSELGFCIDIIDCNDTKILKLISNKKYNLIFGFGENFYQISKLQPEAISILYMTENLPDFSYQEEKKRLDYFFARHKKRIKIQRSGEFYKLYHLEKKYSEVITLGEIIFSNNYYKNTYSVFPTGIINPQFTFNKKNHLLTRKNFLWLGSSGAIHKGLDILIDVFKKREDINLIICGLTKVDKIMLDFPDRNNISDYGHIDIKSDTFLNIIQNCSYIILPSCSEGFSTSITTGMLHGLIPIVMKDTGFNKLMDNAIFLDDYSTEYIDSELNELSCALPEELNLFSKKVFDYARENFLISTFEMRFRIIINDIMKKNKRLGPLKNISKSVNHLL